MSEPIKTIEYKGYHIDIYTDPDAEDPRGWDNLGIMSCKHTRYDLGDNHNFELHKLRTLSENDNLFCLPLYLYDHSGLSMKTVPFSCPWDSGQVGWIFVSKERVREIYNCKRISKQIKEKVYRSLRVEVKLYDDYLAGNIYGYQIRETGDGCWSFFGDDFEMNGLLDDAKENIETDLDREIPLFRNAGVAI